jgi:hypothetical protein
MSVAFRLAKSFDLFRFCAEFDGPLILQRKQKENVMVQPARRSGFRTARDDYDLISAVKTTMFDK